MMHTCTSSHRSSHIYIYYIYIYYLFSYLGASVALFASMPLKFSVVIPGDDEWIPSPEQVMRFLRPPTPREYIEGCLKEAERHGPQSPFDPKRWEKPQPPSPPMGEPPLKKTKTSAASSHSRGSKVASSAGASCADGTLKPDSALVGLQGQTDLGVIRTLLPEKVFEMCLGGL